MFKKDYEKIARVIRETQKKLAILTPAHEYQALRILTDKMCDMLLADNPRFNPVKFRKAALGEKVS